MDFGSALLGLAYAMVTGTCFQVILKKTIGGLRPHFLSVCEPVIPEGLIGVGFNNIMYTAEQVCTGDAKRIKNALESFPSGHAQIAFSGMGFLAIYLFAHLRITSLTRRRGSHWRLLLVVAPLLLSTYLASTLILGYHHHGADVIFGALIGWFMAFMGYRIVFHAILDPRWNTVPYLQLRATRNVDALGPASKSQHATGWGTDSDDSGHGSAATASQVPGESQQSQNHFSSGQV